jgi:hypothetical protein
MMVKKRITTDHSIRLIESMPWDDGHPAALCRCGQRLIVKMKAGISFYIPIDPPARDCPHRYARAHEFDLAENGD